MQNIIKHITLPFLLIASVLMHSCVKDPEVPVVTTKAATVVTTNAITIGGEIIKDGGALITVRGVCWGTTPSPTVSGLHTTDDKGSGSFVSNLTDLAPNTLYYVRAYATNKAGTAYGNEISIKTIPVSLATLSTIAVSSIDLYSALSGGNISSDGGGAIIERGVCWALTQNPTITDFKTTDGTGTGSFSSHLEGLTPGTQYYVRAYSTNSAGTVYGNEVSFTTGAVTTANLTTTGITAITLTSATAGGNVVDNGGADITARGVVYSTTTNPTTTDNKTTESGGIGVFTSNLTGLTPGTQYYVRAYATNSAGTGYGTQVTFSTGAVAIATLTTNAITSLTTTTAVSGGTITADGGGAITAKGVVWATTTNPVITDNKTTNGTGTDAFVSTLASLLPSTTYYARAYATNSAGTGYGPEVSFTTVAVSTATLTTAAITAITSTSATSGGNITTDGNSAVTERGIVYGTATAPTTTNNKVVSGTGTGVFAANLTGLAPGGTYYVRAYAINDGGTAYGNEVSFTTNAILPTVTTTTVTSITANSATSGGNIISNGGGTITVSGICWATTENPLATGLHSTNGTPTGSFASTATGLTASTTYYIRAYATNSAGTAYGNQVSFRTTPETGTVTDVEGNIYKTVKIGTQWWMAEDLKATHYNDNTPLLNVTDNAAWVALTTATPAYCWFGNNPANKATYGALYNWFTVASGDLCPTGWHVPTEAEYQTLELYLGMPAGVVLDWGFRGTDQGTQMKNATGWAAGENGTNTSGFSALPGGYRYGGDGSFQAFGVWTYWWTSSEAPVDDLGTERAWYRRLDGADKLPDDQTIIPGTNSTEVFRGATSKRGGKFIRCVMD